MELNDAPKKEKEKENQLPRRHLPCVAPRLPKRDCLRAQAVSKRTKTGRAGDVTKAPAGRTKEEEKRKQDNKQEG